MSTKNTVIFSILGSLTLLASIFAINNLNGQSGSVVAGKTNEISQETGLVQSLPKLQGQNSVQESGLVEFETIKPELKETQEDEEIEEIVECSNYEEFGVEFLCLLNEYRAENDQKELQLDPKLSFAAEVHSVWMEQNNLFQHLGVDDSWHFDRCQLVGTSCKAENIAFGFASPKHLLKLWQESDEHNKNMLGPYEHIGIGIYREFATIVFR